MNAYSFISRLLTKTAIDKVKFQLDYATPYNVARAMFTWHSSPWRYSVHYVKFVRVVLKTPSVHD